MEDKKFIALEDGKRVVVTDSDDDFPDYHAGWSYLPLGVEIEIKPNKVSINTKYEKQAGFIKHSGFVKGSA